MEVRYTQEYIQANKRTPTDFTQTYGLRFVSNLDAAIDKGFRLLLHISVLIMHEMLTRVVPAD